MPNTQEKLKKLIKIFKTPITLHDVNDKLYSLLGDDILFDEIEVWKKEFDIHDDLRHAISNWVLNHWFKNDNLNHIKWSVTWDSNVLNDFFVLMKKYTK